MRVRRILVAYGLAWCSWAPQSRAVTSPSRQAVMTRHYDLIVGRLLDSSTKKPRLVPAIRPKRLEHCCRQGARHRPGERIPGVGGGRRIVTGARLRPSKRVKRVKFAAFVASNTPRRRSGTSAPKEEDAMNSRRLYGTIVLALACGIGTGAAQVGQIQLDVKQKAAIVSAVRDVRNAPPGHSFNVSVGAQVPPSIELYYLPAAALSQAPETRALKYTMVQNQVVLVDPTNMRIVEVIRPGQ